ncbi:MAG: site-specific DNA-methyltransferase [Candidatus Omnitrophica bacterium]|nr:site-specific DNA-methyltransferase [Candidatus Omnitrophota bacterium]
MPLELFFNEDCIEGCKRHIPDGSVDLIITDPPYGISGDTLHKHYNRKEEFVIDGYIEVPQEDYAEFTRNWVRQAERILRPGGSIYVVSGYTHLIHVLNSLAETSLREVNHLIWKYNFGVFTQKKFVSSHYHILYYTKPGGTVTFNTYSRYGNAEKTEDNRSLNYQDREDVWFINKEYKPGQAKNKNELPKELLIKMIQYSSNEEDLVFDLFLGSFSTAKVAIALNRQSGGFELSKSAFRHQLNEIKKVNPGSLLKELRVPNHAAIERQGKLWTEDERGHVWNRYQDLRSAGATKKGAIEIICEEFGRGRFAVAKVVSNLEATSKED